MLAECVQVSVIEISDPGASRVKRAGSEGIRATRSYKCYKCVFIFCSFKIGINLILLVFY